MSRSFLTGLNLNKNELLNARIQNLATPPSNPVAGQIYFDTDTNQITLWDGSAWVGLAAGGDVSGQITSAINALTTDDIEEGSTNLYYHTANAKADAAALLTNATLTNITITGDGDGLTITAENGGIQTGDNASLTTLALTSNGDGDNLQIGDDTLIGDVNLSDTVNIQGVEHNTKGFVSFGQNGSLIDGTGQKLNYVGFDGTNTVLNSNGAVVITSTTGNIDLYANTAAYVNEDEIVTVSATQTLTNKTYSTPTLKGTVSFTNSSNTEILAISQTGVGTVRINATDDLSLRSTNGDIILYPGNEIGGVGKVYIGYGNANPATGAGIAGAGNEVATLGDTQTFTNKTIGAGGLYFNDGSNDSQIYTNGNDLTVSANNDLYLNTVNGKIDLQPDTGGANVWGDRIVTATSSQTLTNKVLGSTTTLGANLGGEGTYTLVNIVDPTNPQDAATKAYVDATAQGLSVKTPVLAVSHGEGSYPVSPSNLGSVSSIGGVSLVNGGRFLLVEQATASQNGIYVYDSGTNTLSRAADQQTVDKGDYTLVTNGTYASTGWIASSTTTWSQFSAANEYTAGNGIDITGNAVSAKLDSDSLSVSGAGLKVNYHTDGGLDNDSGLYVKLGTGLTFDGGGNVTFDTGYGVRKYAENNSLLQPTSNVVSWTVTHNFGTRDVTVQVFENSTYTQVEVDVARTSTSVVTLSWVATANVTADTYRVVVVG